MKKEAREAAELQVEDMEPTFSTRLEDTGEGCALGET